MDKRKRSGNRFRGFAAAQEPEAGQTEQAEEQGSRGGDNVSVITVIVVVMVVIMIALVLVLVLALGLELGL